jgi:DNA-binding MarR family transcriptional regulator
MDNIELFPKRSNPCHCLNIRRASQAVTQFYDKFVEQSGLKLAQFSLVRHLELVEPVTITELAKIMRIDRTTLSRNMKPMLKAGLIIVNFGEDPRSRQVMLTETGKAALVSANKLWDKAQESLEEYLGEELHNFEKVLSKLEALKP